LVKRFISVILQTLLLLITFFLGSFLPAFNKLPMWRVEVGATHYFVLDGLVLMFALYLLILAIEAARKRLRPSAALTTLALVLALALGLAMKFGFMERPAGF
jgi:hypothetical protein